NAMALQRLKALAAVFLGVGLLVGGAGAFWRFGGAAPAAAADRPAGGLTGAGGRSGEEGRDADRPGQPEDSGPSATAPPGQAEKPLGAPPRALAPPAGDGDRPLQTRVGLINMSRALKGSRKAQALQAELQAMTQQARQKLEKLTKEARNLQAECDAPAT